VGLLALAGIGCNSAATSGSTRQRFPITEPDVPAPTADNPVTAVALLTPLDVAPAAAAELRVRLRIAPGHHLYAPAPPGAAATPFIAATVDLKSSDVLQPAGDWVAPVANADGHLTGTVEFRRPVRVVAGAAPGSHEASCVVTYQACTSELCWPPRAIQVNLTFTVAPVR
jgi:hypothetical protein